MNDIRQINHFHFACGLGGGKKGFNKSSARVGNMIARSRCIGGIDIDQAAIRDFDKMGDGRAGTVMDLFTREQYIAFNGHEPPAGWQEATPQDIQQAAGNEHPHIVFISSPCKGLSGLLSETLSKTGKYQALNQLTLRCVWLMCEAWKDDPVELIVFENVPRIATRGRPLLDQINQLLRHYGYAVAETTHDCGELGNLAQSRKRFLLVARHMEKIPNYLYEPKKRPLRAVGEVLSRMLMPGDLRAGPMHRIPSLQWKTWVRLAFVEAGSDWRSLNKLAVEDGVLRDYLIVPEFHHGYLGVNAWDKNMGVVTGKSMPANGKFAVSDPRYSGKEYSQYGVLPFDKSMGVISSQSKPGGGVYSIADPRIDGVRHNNVFRIVNFDHAAGTITGGGHPTAGGQAVADPRPNWENRYGNLAVMDWERHTNTVIGGGKGVQGGYMSIADPRTNIDRQKGDAYLTGGHYGVVPFDSPTGAISASGKFDNGKFSVADPRMPDAAEKLVAIIQSLDGTWHRPFTTLEMAALQSLIDPEEYLELEGLSDQAWRERIGNAVPSDSAEAIGNELFRTILLAWSGETFMLSAAPIWVQPAIVGLMAAQ